MPRKRISKKARTPAGKPRSRCASKSKRSQASARVSITPPTFERRAEISALPRELRDAVDGAIAQRPEGLESIRKIYDHFELSDHKIPYRSFADYVRRDGWRARLGATRQVVDAMFGPLELSQLERVGNDALMQLIALVSQTLQRDSSEISTSELAKLSKIIAELRAGNVKKREVELKEEAKAANCAASDGHGELPRGGLPENFGEIVRRIYGVELKDVGAR